MSCTLWSVINVLMLRCSFVSVSVCKQDTLGSVFWVTMLRSLWSCAWLGSMDAGFSWATVPCGEREPLHSSTRQVCNVAWPGDFQVLGWSLFNFIFKIGRKMKKSVSLKSPRVRLRSCTWLIFNFDLSSKTPGKSYVTAAYKLVLDFPFRNFSRGRYIVKYWVI